MAISLPAAAQRLVKADDGGQHIGFRRGLAVFGGEARAVRIEHFLEIHRAGLVERPGERGGVARRLGGPASGQHAIMTAGVAGQGILDILERRQNGLFIGDQRLRMRPPSNKVVARLPASERTRVSLPPSAATLNACQPQEPLRARLG